MSISRRQLLTGLGTLGLASITPVAWGRQDDKGLETQPRHLRFVHFTDLHIQPELGASEGVALAVQKVLSLRPRPDFIITGGDHVMDLLKVSRARADVQFELLAEAMKPLEMPVYSVIGNHDIFGWSDKAEDANDPGYGKSMIEEHVIHGPAYRSFDHLGIHFVLLDSVQPGGASDWFSAIDDAQLTWLNNDLEKTAKRPTIVVTHVPVMTLFTQYTSGTLVAPSDSIILRNGMEVQSLISQHNVLAVLQGHTHVVEDCGYRGTRYITGGAVCGDWWKGYRLGVHPEGFMVYDVTPTSLSATYTPYGWKARA